MDSGHLPIFKGKEVSVQEISDHLKHLLQEFKSTSQLELEVTKFQQIEKVTVVNLDRSQISRTCQEKIRTSSFELEA